jgi:oxalate decarboxylase/phosphoglucose isomerase-like protein (cupin superfamily)
VCHAKPSLRVAHCAWLFSFYSNELTPSFTTRENELYIFPTDVPGPLNQIEKGIQGPGGAPANPFSFPLSKMNATKLAGGTVKVVDSTLFKVSTTIAAAEVTIEPGAMRELHVSG